MLARILILGCKGQVGQELVATLMPLGQLFAVSRDQCDLCDKQALASLIQSHKPSIVVNAAAYTQVDRAEEAREQCFAVNALAPKYLAELCEKNKMLLVQYSTDYVFDGESNTPWLETSPVNPKSVYGESKLAGENYIVESGCNHLILRTSWVYGLRGNNFLLTMLRLAQEKEVLTIVDDQTGAPTWSRTIAQNTAFLLYDYLLKKNRPEVKEVLHFSATGQTSWYGFAREIISIANRATSLNLIDPENIKPVSSDEYPQKAYRPKYSVLNTTKLENLYQIKMPNWKEQLNSCLSFY